MYMTNFYHDHYKRRVFYVVTSDDDSYLYVAESLWMIPGTVA